MIDLRICRSGDILISSHGAKLEYVAPTPWKHYKYLDHVVRYIEDADGKSYEPECYGTRTHDGYVFAKKRIPDVDHDIVEIIRKRRGKNEGKCPIDGRENRPVYIKINGKSVLAIADGKGHAYKVYGEGYDVLQSECKPENMYNPDEYEFERGLSGMEF